MGKKDIKPLHCLPGQGCATVIEMRTEFTSFMAVAKKSMEDHNEISELVWKNHKEKLDAIFETSKRYLDAMENASKSVVESNERMNTVEKDTKAHIEGKYNIHQIINIVLGSLCTVMTVIFIFVSSMHPEFWKNLL